MAKIKQVDIIKTQLCMYKENPELTKSSKGWSEEQYQEEIASLEKKIQYSKRGKSSKAKGGDYERKIAKIFKDKLGIELVRTPLSGGFQKNSKATNIKGDISNIDDRKNFNLHIECKNHATWAVPKWIEQSESDCPDSKVPIVVMHRRQKNKDGQRVQDSGDYVVLNLFDFLEIVNYNKIIQDK